MTGLVAGSGIWTTHFVAMLAFKTGLATGFAEIPTLGSLGIAVISTTLGFALASSRPRRDQSEWTSIAGGLIVGLGITLMHYVGMNGYRTTGDLEWDPAYVTASVVIGGLLAATALRVAQPSSPPIRRLAGCALLSLAIVGMHFTGMTAVTIVPDARVIVPPSLLSDSSMIIIAVAMTALILLTSIGGVAFDSASRNGTLRRLREALDVMPEGLAFYDSSDRLVAWNTQYQDLCRASGAEPYPGMPFADLLSSSLVHGAYPSAVGREAEWLTERNAARRGEIPSLTDQTAAGRWLRITDRRTGDGGTVSVSVDITELKRTELAMAEARDHAEEQARRAEAAEMVAGLGHWRLDAETREITWSTQVFRIYGLPEDEPLDLNSILTMNHPDDAAISNARLARQLVSGETDENSISRIIRASGEIRFLLGNSRVERAPDGRIVAVIGTVVDVTDQKAAEIAVAQSEERFRRIAVNAPDMITESRLDGVLTYVSPASLAITGFAPEELIGRSFDALMEPEDAHRLKQMCETVIASKGEVAPWSVEFRTKHKSGADLWLECKPSFAADPETGRFTGLNDVIRDVTQRKLLEAQLRQSQAEAEEAASVKADFLANMSHELRTPLTSIIGFTNLVAEQSDLAPLTRTYVDRVRDAGRALLCTVNDILDFSKLEAGQVSIQPEPVNLDKLSRATLDLFTPQAGAKDLHLVLDSGPTDEILVLSLDPDRIRQILLNFVSNAVKFTADGSVTLRTRYDRASAVLRVEVADTGAGIPQEKLDSLFKRFSQIDGSLTRAQSGTGLGLAICKGLVEAMGGRVGVESQLGFGSKFWFEIPAAIAILPSADNELEQSGTSSYRGVRVLVADDHAANRQLANLFLAGIGAEVTEAVDGEDAVAIAAEEPFDVILMDVRMPKLDGPGALRRIRASEGPNDNTPILAFTADAAADATDQLLSLGFQDVVAKPIDPLDLISALNRATAPYQAPAKALSHAG